MLGITSIKPDSRSIHISAAKPLNHQRPPVRSTRSPVGPAKRRPTYHPYAPSIRLAGVPIYKKAALPNLCAATTPSGEARSPSATSPKALPLARRAFPFISHFTAYRESAASRHPSCGEAAILPHAPVRNTHNPVGERSERAYHPYAPSVRLGKIPKIQKGGASQSVRRHLPLGRSPFPLSHLAKRYPSATYHMIE